MSRIGKKPVPVPAGVKVKIAGRDVSVSGPKGTLAWTAPEPIEVGLGDNQVVVRRPDDQPQNRALHGLSRALIANMVTGVTKGYVKKLEIYGAGFSVKKQGQQLWLNVGFVGRGHNRPAQFMIEIPAGIEVDVETEAARGDSDPAKFSVRGIDKQAVGQFAAELRKLRKPEPYKGKGLRYAGEQIRRKAGKVFASGG
ncbi:MAG: 50S ribosomal protein L6 [Phycisphaerae bacterium]